MGAQLCCAQGPTSSILITMLLPLSTAQHRPAEVMSDEEKGKNARAVQPPNVSFEASVGKVGGNWNCFCVFNSYENSVACLLCISGLCL